ncbi:calmodulin-like [Condylostylus longicornis]|uniref:calmodulin-like n=1 Tax=Condylostylus longicornis TaxID=2530218 RepID=UPI00244DA3B4|nr:calmodulin-like [Condylostylus longicornis]
MSAAMKEAFCLFDRDADGLIHARDIPTVIRSLGVHVSDTDLNSMLNGKEEMMFSYDAFVQLAGGRCSSTDQVAELTKALKTFDRDNNGTISAGELKHVLLNLGEKLNEADVEELLRAADPQNTGNIRYGEFAVLLSGKSN